MRVMTHRFIATIFTFIASLTIYAQDLCVINGNIADSKLANGETIKKVFLTSTDENGRKTVVAEAKVKKGAYAFKYKIAQDAPAMLYAITGFDNGKEIKLFVEPGTVNVNTATAANPCQSEINGTPTNDLYSAYKEIDRTAAVKVAKEIEALEQKNGKEWTASKEGKQEIKRITATERIKTEAERIRFLIDNNASPMTPFEMEHTVLPYLSDAYAEQMVKSISAKLNKHPYYQSFRNAVLARTLKVGNEVPNITITLGDGKETKLNDHRGKFILLDIWASGCEKSIQTRETLKEIYEITKEQQENFIIVSLSVDSDKAAWNNAIATGGTALSGWVQGIDPIGTESINIKLLGVDATPRMILIDPEGRLISRDLKSDEAVMRVEQILEGDLYYLDQNKD